MMIILLRQPRTRYFIYQFDIGLDKLENTKHAEIDTLSLLWEKSGHKMQW